MGERIVRIITPEIINRMNQEITTDPDFAREWSETLDKLELHNKEIIEVSPQSVADFINNSDLFNSTALIRSSSVQQDQYLFAVEQPDAKRIVYIGYTLVGDVQQIKHSGSGFDSGLVLWLYDEFHKTDNCLQHHIIFSDGLEYIVPFKTLQVRLTPWFEE